MNALRKDLGAPEINVCSGKNLVGSFKGLDGITKVKSLSGYSTSELIQAISDKSLYAYAEWDGVNDIKARPKLRKLPHSLKVVKGKMPRGFTAEPSQIVGDRTTAIQDRGPEFKYRVMNIVSQNRDRAKRTGLTSPWKDPGYRFGLSGDYAGQDPHEFCFHQYKDVVPALGIEKPFSEQDANKIARTIELSVLSELRNVAQIYTENVRMSVQYQHLEGTGRYVFTTIIHGLDRAGMDELLFTSVLGETRLGDSTIERTINILQEYLLEKVKQRKKNENLYYFGPSSGPSKDHPVRTVQNALRLDQTAR